jgi:hypothetical protein
MPDYVPIMEIAETLGIDPTTVRRIIRRYGQDLGLVLERKKSNARNGRWVDCLSMDDRNRLVDFYESNRGITEETVGESLARGRFGEFYIMQVVPEAIPNRVKIGYSDDLEKRMTEHRTAAPTANLLGHWPCKRSWDHAAMDAITREGCHLVLNEVYEGEIEGFLERAQGFFAQMPHPSHSVPLSENSPLSKRDTEEASQKKEIDS